MAYRRGSRSIREAYEECFPDSREVTGHRVVNIVEKRSRMPRPLLEYDRAYDDQWYGDPRHYQEAGESHGEDSYRAYDRRYYDDNFGNFRRNNSPPRHDGPYSQQSYGRDDLRHQLVSRNNGRGGPYYRSRGRGSGPPIREDRDDYRRSPPIVIKRDRSPARREAQPSVPVRSASNSSNRTFSPDREKGHNYQQAQQKYKPSVQTSHTPSSSVEEAPQSSASSKEKTPASVAETEEEVAAASMEPKLTPEDDFKARRSEAIKAKALEIEKHYRQDCETFRTVVKMLVAKEPSLDNLLQAPLDKNLLELKDRCLDSLRHFVKELDEVLKQPDISE
ncbi:periphilin-1 isoform X2 [Plectropomus leopardus]|uniref:periphilin-1 isoform X1 n=1 Tax=Plectropomus leopardus TaxID=160734 RepID=UPI001C4B4716|nr:periphilin-1 isoform X1 [Plectropomus leopardus]XP_042352449.1 periphilin-1 isoform X2 [Plectropomus leopardus]